MGFQKTLSREENQKKGLFPSAYFKIQSLTMDNGKVNVSMRGYCDKEARDLESSSSSSPSPYPGANDVSITQPSFSIPEGNLPSPTLKTISEAARLKHIVYLWLKTQDSFRTATDIFETGQNVPVE